MNGNEAGSEGRGGCGADAKKGGNGTKRLFSERNRINISNRPVFGQGHAHLMTGDRLQIMSARFRIMSMFHCIIGEHHFWQGTQFMYSDEKTKTLLAFKSIDDCITHLYMTGNKELARALHKIKTEKKA